MNIGHKAGLAGIAALLAAVPAVADWPEKPIKVVVPYAAGGSLSGNTTLAFDQAFQEQDILPEPLQVTNMPGAGGAIGAREVANAEPDGHTILVWNDSLITNKVLERMEFGPEDFETVAQTGDYCVHALVPEAAPYNTMAEFVAYAKEHPNEIVEAANIGATGHFASVRINDALGIQTRYVASGGPARRMPDLAGRHIDYTISSTNSYVQYKDIGIKSLGIFADERDPRAPEIPTMKEQGLDAPNYCSTVWWFAPKGTPRPVIDELAAAFRQGLGVPSVLEYMENSAVRPSFLGPDELRQVVDERYEIYKQLAAEYADSFQVK